jgi:hypothetical protein
MRDLARPNRSDRLSRQRLHGDCVASQSDELDFKGFPIWIRIDDGTDIAGRQTDLRQVTRQYNSVELFQIGFNLSECGHL